MVCYRRKGMEVLQCRWRHVVHNHYCTRHRAYHHYLESTDRQTHDSACIASSCSYLLSHRLSILKVYHSMCSASSLPSCKWYRSIDNLLVVARGRTPLILCVPPSVKRSAERRHSRGSTLRTLGHPGESRNTSGLVHPVLPAASTLKGDKTHRWQSWAVIGVCKLYDIRCTLTARHDHSL